MTTKDLQTEDIPGVVCNHRPEGVDRNTGPSSRSGFVYVVEAEHDRIKIGWSAQPRARVERLEREFGILYVWACVPGTQADERRLHARWADDRLEGEWFRATDELRLAAEEGRLFAVSSGLCKFAAAPGVSLLMQGRPA